MNQTLVIIPTYNEALNIPRLLGEVLANAPAVDILVVDDSSPDGTQDLVVEKQKSEPRVHLLSRPKKQGLAAAYGAGFLWAMDRNYANVIEMDADFSHSPLALPSFLEALKTHDVVIGCRYMKGGGITGWGWLRKVISYGGNFYARHVLNCPFLDLTGGFNAWRLDVLRSIDGAVLKSKGYAFQIELKYKAYKAGFRLTEIPIQFDNRRYGTSKMSSNIVWEAALRVLQMRRKALAN